MQNGVETPSRNGIKNEENEAEIPENSINCKSNKKLIFKIPDLETSSNCDFGDNKIEHRVKVDPYSIITQSYDLRTIRHPEFPKCIMEASDPFFNPAIYKRYTICTDIEDTFPERLAKHIENLKDATRDRAVTSITAGENAVYWLVRTFKYLTSGWFGLVIMLIIVLAYGTLGAFVFMVLEGTYENTNHTEIMDIRGELVNKLDKILGNYTIMKTNPDIYSLLEADLEIYENKRFEYMKKSELSKNFTEKTWNFWNSFVFAGTVYTTIGYGHIAPQTVAGQAATVAYAIIGIPLFLVALTSFGKFLTRIINFFWRLLTLIFCCKSACTKNTEEVKSVEVYRPAPIEDEYRFISSNVERKTEAKPKETVASENEIELDEEFNLPTSLALSILILYILCGAAIANIFEDWTYFEAIYCIFISMSTIGFGDLVISDSLRMIYSIVYIIFGLSLTAMCINVIQKQVTVMFRNAREKINEMVDKTEYDKDSDSN